MLRRNPRMTMPAVLRSYKPWQKDMYPTLELSDAQTKRFEKQYKRMQRELAVAMEVPVGILFDEFGMDFDPVALARLFLDDQVPL